MRQERVQRQYGVSVGTGVVGCDYLDSVGTSKRDRQRAPSDISPVHIRLSTDDRKRLKHICTDLDCTYEAFLVSAMDRHERKSAPRAVVRSPLHDGDDDW